MIAQLNQMAHIWWQWMGGMFWQVGLLILLVTVIDMAIRRWAWPQVRYVLWGLVFLKLVIPPTWEMPTSMASWATPLYEKYVSTQVPPGETAFRIDLAPVAEISPESRGSAIASPAHPTWQTALFMAWIGGICIFSTVLAIRLSRFRRDQRRKKGFNAFDPDSPGWFHDLLSETSNRLKLRRTPEVIFSDHVKSPAVFGLIRPTLLLPRQYLGGLSREQAEHVLIHELCHLKRGDLWVHWLCLLIQIVYWFNPLLIWTRRRMRHVCEICCDLSVAEILREKTRHYRETLLKTARELFCETMEPSLGLLGLFEEPFRLVPRLRWLERETWGRRKRKIAAALVTSFVMVTCVLPMSGFSSSALPGEYTLETVSATPEADGPFSDEAKAAMGETNRRFGIDPDDLAAAREPLIDYLDTHPQASIPKELYTMLAQLWYIDENNDEHMESANRVYKAAYETYPDETDFLLNHAAITFALGQHEDAAPLFETLYLLDENHDVDYLKNAAACYSMAGNEQETQRLMDLLPPSERPVHTVLPEDAETALTEAQQQLEANPDDFAAARKPLIDFWETHSNNSVPKQLYMMLAQLWYSEGDLEAANSVYETAYDSYPDETGFLLNIAVTTYELGNYEDAAPLFENYYLLDESHDVKFLENAAGLYEMTGNESDAERIRSQLADISQPSGSSNTAPTVISDADTPPQVLEAFKPRYPDDAKENGIEGKVLLRFLVDTDGYAKEPEIVEATPADIFDDAALEAISFYKFQPAAMDGMPVRCIVQLPVEFHID